MNFMKICFIIVPSSVEVLELSIQNYIDFEVCRDDDNLIITTEKYKRYNCFIFSRKDDPKMDSSHKFLLSPKNILAISKSKNQIFVPLQVEIEAILNCIESDDKDSKISFIDMILIFITIVNLILYTLYYQQFR